MREWSIEEFNILQSPGTLQSEIPEAFTEAGAYSPGRFHKQIDGYEKTPLVSLGHLAEKWGVKAIYVKDESGRFSLNAFKGLGGSYAMFRIICEILDLDPEKTSLKDLTGDRYKKRISDIDFVTCTDGNHGRGVSWAAGIFGCKAHIYMPCGSREVRAEAIRNAGPAEVEITDLSYDDTVRYAREMSEKKGWILIQDTSWDGYEKVPAWIIQGYMTMASEAAEDLDALGVQPTHIFLQAGVGSMAGGVLAYFVDHYKNKKPVAAIVEPVVADCVYQSAKAGEICSVEGTPTTVMEGLNCGTPCKIIWPILRDLAEFYISGPDEMAVEGKKTYAAGLAGDTKVDSGESGSSTLGAAQRIITVASFTEVKQAMRIDENSVLLFFNTEGNTD